MAIDADPFSARLDRHPASVLHHVRSLTELGFLVAEAPRRGRRGAREIPYRATGLSWQLSIGHEAPRDLMLATFLEEVAAVGEEHLDSMVTHRCPFLPELACLFELDVSGWEEHDCCRLARDLARGC